MLPLESIEFCIREGLVLFTTAVPLDIAPERRRAKIMDDNMNELIKKKKCTLANTVPLSKREPGTQFVPQQQHSVSR
jgi:hypothetical protein